MSGGSAELQRAYRDVVGHFATGVTIVTTSGPEGAAGMTTNAVTSLSLDPLLLLVCFDRDSRTLDAVRASRRFTVNVLRACDRELAAVFASKRVGRDKFASVTHAAAHGMPVLDSALAWISCELRELLPGGDHVIGIGEVIDMGSHGDADPLVYFRGRYTTLASPAG
ncbi:MAG: flavin reductase family protein [Solirubrobacterales bacterium]|nr:flavin reductase family protein [Solirubrobacterales bacterium]